MEQGARSKKWVMRNIDWGISNQILNIISNSLEIIFLKNLKIFENIFWKFLKKYFQICGRNILKIFEKDLENFGKNI